MFKFLKRKAKEGEENMSKEASLAVDELSMKVLDLSRIYMKRLEPHTDGFEDAYCTIIQGLARGMALVDLTALQVIHEDRIPLNEVSKSTRHMLEHYVEHQADLMTQKALKQGIFSGENHGISF